MPKQFENVTVAVEYLVECHGMLRHEAAAYVMRRSYITGSARTLWVDLPVK